MTEVSNKLLLAENKFMSVIHLRQAKFIYSACRLFAKNKVRIENFKEAGDSRYIY